MVSSSRFSLRTSRQTPESQSQRTAADENRIWGGDHPSALEFEHPDVGRGAAGGEAAHHVLQRQDGTVRAPGDSQPSPHTRLTPACAQALLSVPVTPLAFRTVGSCPQCPPSFFEWLRLQRGSRTLQEDRGGPLPRRLQAAPCPLLLLLCVASG